MSTFDPYAWEGFFFGALERDDACRMLLNEPVGAFLLRESHSRPGGYSLTVRECMEGERQIYHYFIEKKEIDGKTRFEMCGNVFIDIPSLLVYYQIHILEKSCLIEPILKKALCKVIGLYKFDGERATDLPFEKGEILEIISKPEESWWTARNALNDFGLIPVTYVKILKEDDDLSLSNRSLISNFNEDSFKRLSANSDNSDQSISSNPRNLQFKRSSQDNIKENKKSSLTTAKLPAWCRVIADRYPSIYDTEAFTIKQGQLIFVIEVLLTGFCRCQMEANGPIGVVPFTYIEWTNIPLNSGPWIPDEDKSIAKNSNQQ